MVEEDNVSVGRAAGHGGKENMVIKWRAGTAGQAARKQAASLVIGGYPEDLPGQTVGGYLALRVQARRGAALMFFLCLLTYTPGLHRS